MTMPRKILLPLLFLAVILSLCGEEKSSPGRQNQFLKEELSLAKSPASYFIFDLQGKTVLLKSRGMALKEWKIQKSRSWGNSPPLWSLTLEKKSALFAPKRKKIKPGANQEGATFELDVLELKDMPSSYLLNLTDGISIYIRPKPGSFISRMGGVGRFFQWYFWIPLKNLWFETRKKPFTALEIKLSSREDTRALFWALVEGFRGLVIPK